MIDYLSGRSLHDLIMNTESIDLGTISVLMKVDVTTYLVNVGRHTIFTFSQHDAPRLEA